VENNTAPRDFVGPELPDIAFAAVCRPRLVLEINATPSRAVPKYGWLQGRRSRVSLSAVIAGIIGVPPVSGVDDPGAASSSGAVAPRFSTTRI
jgi:hypothetical protein